MEPQNVQGPLSPLGYNHAASISSGCASFHFAGASEDAEGAHESPALMPPCVCFRDR